MSSFLPKSLITRFFLIIIVPVIVAQLIIIHFFYSKHWYNVVDRVSAIISSEIKMVFESLENKDMGTFDYYAKLLEYEILDKDNEVFGDIHSNNVQEIKILKRRLNQKINSPYRIFYLKKSNLICVNKLINTQNYNICFSSKRVVNPTVYVFILWVISLNLFFIVISLVFTKNQIRSIAALAKAAESFGYGLNDQNFKPSGAIEVRSAWTNFLKMKDKIARNLEKRSELIASISHDLRTPLTRINLELELMDKTEEVLNIKKDIQEMQQMISSYLEYSKNEFIEQSQYVEIREWINEILEDLKYSSLRINLKKSEKYFCYIKKDIFKRVIANILDNSSRYAKNVVISISSSIENIVIDIDDDGIGIDEDKRNLIFGKFYTTQDKSVGFGLGLNIAKQIVLSHHGNIEILKSELGGARLRIELPRLDDANFF